MPSGRIVRFALCLGYFAFLSFLIDGFSKNFDNDINLNFINNQSNYGFVAINNETIIGFASIHIIEKLNRRSCLIEDVVVDKKERGKGIGKLLIEHLINFSKSKSWDKIILNSKESNIPFYNKLGFVQNEIQMIIRN